MSETSRRDVQPPPEKPSLNQKARGVYFFLSDLGDWLGSSTGGPSGLDRSLTDQKRKDEHNEPIENVRRTKKDVLVDLYKDTQSAYELKKRADQGSLTQADEPAIEALIEKYRPIDQDLKLARLSDMSLKGV